MKKLLQSIFLSIFLLVSLVSALDAGIIANGVDYSKTGAE